MNSWHYNRWKELELAALSRLAVIVFVAIVFPVWCFRACRSVDDNSNNASGSDKLTYTKIDIQETYSWKSSPINISLYDSNIKQSIEIDLEEYLVGVLSAEMPASFDSEALKAQAVAARTYTVKKLPAYRGDGCSKGADICADSSHCQAYNSAAERREKWGNNAAENEIKIRTAIQDTFGEIVTYDEEPIEAFFHSTAGGMTENSENAFSQALPYLKSVVSNEVSAPRYENELSLTRSEFIKTINSKYPKAKLKDSSLETNVEILSQFSSGRLDKIRLGKSEISGKELRSLFSLDSTNISIEFADNYVTLHTKGYGHGVGMSQTGADDMAAAGRSYDEILLYYYQNTEIRKIY